MADPIVEDILVDVHRKGIKPFQTGMWGFGFDLERDMLEAFQTVKSKLESRNYEAVQIGEVPNESLLLGSLKKPVPCNSVKLEFALKELDEILAKVNSRINQFAFLPNETTEMLEFDNEVKDQLLNSIGIENTRTGETFRRKGGVFERVSGFFSKKGK